MSRAKGHILERFVEQGLQSLGIWAARTPSAHDKGIDLNAEIGGELRTFQCWTEGNGFREIYQRIGPVDFAVFNADYKPKLVAMRWELFLMLLKAALWRQSQPARAAKAEISNTHLNGTTCDDQA